VPPREAGAHGGVRAPRPRHFAPKATNGLRHLDADRPASEHEQPAGDGLHGGHLTVRPNAFEVVQTRHRRDDGLRTRRYDHVSGCVANAVDVDHARPSQPGATAKQVDAMLGEPTLLARIGVMRNHGVAPGKGRFDVDLRCRRRVVRAVDGLPRTQQRFGWDARPIGAFATDELVLDVRRADRPLRARRRSARPASRRR
jgi:hypothetical protein